MAFRKAGWYIAKIEIKRGVAMREEPLDLRFGSASLVVPLGRES